MRIKLFASGEKVNGHESVGVTAGGVDEAHWRLLGYLPADELDAPAPVAREEPVIEAALASKGEASSEGADSEATPEPEIEPEPKKRRGRPRKVRS